MDQCSLNQVEETFSFFFLFYLLSFDAWTFTLPLNIWFKLYIKDGYRQYDIIHFVKFDPLGSPSVGFSRDAQVIS